MSFVMICTDATRGSPMRTVSMAQLLCAGVLGALALLAGGGVLGYWFAVPAPALEAQVLAPRAHAALPFALEQLGALSGRLFRLESQAAQLSKRIGVLQKDDPAPARDAKKAGSGGPMLAAHGAPSALDGIDALDAQLARIELEIARVSDATSERGTELMRLPTRLPVSGAELVSGFGNRTDPIANRTAFHAGLDFAAQHGTPIRSAAGGTVRFAGFRSDYGWLVEIDHGNGLATRYGHASKLLVQAGMVVGPGERIALVGSTGRSTGPHLHFEVLRSGGHVDPRHYLARY